jgi:hypothetical protein
VKRLFLTLTVAGICFAQVSFPTTTLLQSIDKYYPGDIGLASTVALAPGYPGFAVSTSGVGDPYGHTGIIIMIDSEAMCQMAAPMGNYVKVDRGCQGTPTEGHNAGATVYIGPASWYLQNTPGGSCVSAEQPALPRPVIPGGQLWNCIPPSPAAGTWVPVGMTVKRKSTTDGSEPTKIDPLQIIGFIGVLALILIALYVLLQKHEENERNG